MKAIAIIGGGSSEIGKTYITASLGYLLKERGVKVNPLKFDGYLNQSTGTMCKYHVPQAFISMDEEVFVLNDGTECDSDLGIYERFLGEDLSKESYITNGSLLFKLITKDKGNGNILTFSSLKREYLNSLQLRSKNGVLLVEVGGTIGDPENSFFIELLAELSHSNRIFFILVAPALHIHEFREDVAPSSGSKLVRSAFKQLLKKGIKSDAIILRSRVKLPKSIIKHIQEDTSVKQIIEVPFMDSPYKIPAILDESKLLESIAKKLNLKISKRRSEYSLSTYVRKISKLKRQVKVLILDKMESYGSYVSLREALYHAGAEKGILPRIMWIGGKLDLRNVNGIILLNDYENRNIKFKALKTARDLDIPTLAISGGFFLMVEEYLESMGHNTQIVSHGRLKVGRFKTKLLKNSLIRTIYKKDNIWERHRHTEFIEDFSVLENTPLSPVGFSEEGHLDAVELKGSNFYIGVSYHPEFSSKPNLPHPLFSKFIEACLRSA